MEKKYDRLLKFREACKQAETFSDIVSALLAVRREEIRLIKMTVRPIVCRPTAGYSPHRLSGDDQATLLKQAELRIKDLNERLKRNERFHANKSIPAKLLERIETIEWRILRLSFFNEDTSRRGFSVSDEKRELAVLIERAECLVNPPKPLITINAKFKMGKCYSKRSISGSYDGYVWQVLLGHFEPLEDSRGRHTIVKVVAALPEKSEYLQLKEHRFTCKVDALLAEAYEIVHELQNELQEAYDNMPDGLQDGTVNQARLEAISGLEFVSNDQVELSDDVSTLRCCHFPALRQKSRSDRACEAAAMLRAVSAAIMKRRKKNDGSKKSDVLALQECCEKLDSQAEQLAQIEFPGMFG